MPPSKVHATLVEPMLLLRTDKLPQGSAWLYELKLDGYRAVAFKDGGKVACALATIRILRASTRRLWCPTTP
jgi:ATP-dependent DNA ligase